MFLTQHLYFLKPGDSTPGPSVNPLYSKCKISNFVVAHDSIKSNLPTSFCDSITINIPPPYFRNQEANQVNIRTVRTKTSGSNSIKSKSANIWKFLQIFINRLFYNGLCLTVPLLFIIYLFFCCVWFLSVLLVLVFMYLMVLSCIFGEKIWTSYMLTDCLPSNCKKIYFWRIHTY